MASNVAETRGSMVGSSRTSLFSPGSTLRGASPGLPNGSLGATGQEWIRRSQEGEGYTPSSKQSSYKPSGEGVMNSTYGSMAGGNNPFKNPEGRAMRRMISLENENPRGSYNGPVGPR